MRTIDVSSVIIFSSFCLAIERVRSSNGCNALPLYANVGRHRRHASKPPPPPNRIFITSHTSVNVCMCSLFAWTKRPARLHSCWCGPFTIDAKLRLQLTVRACVRLILCRRLAVFFFRLPHNKFLFGRECFSAQTGLAGDSVDGDSFFFFFSSWEQNVSSSARIEIAIARVTSVRIFDTSHFWGGHRFGPHPISFIVYALVYALKFSQSSRTPNAREKVGNELYECETTAGG